MPARREAVTRLPEACAAKYRVIRPLARGGFGQVLLAEHRELRRPVALKLLDPAMLGDPTQVRRFVEEARITAALSHPHIVVILDHGTGDGAPWIAYEYLEGGSLRDRMRGGGLTVQESLAVGIQSAAALHQAHLQGILHRDIKPENLLLAQPGHWKVTDFGIAKWSRPGGVQTQSGVLIGTPLYLSPEQIGSRAPEPASDLYALGVVLYECLAGHPPFDHEEVGELLRAHLEQTPTRPGAGRPDVPAALEEVVLRCLEKEPARRFPTAAALEEALAGCAGQVAAPSRLREPEPRARVRSDRSAATLAARTRTGPGAAGTTLQSEPAAGSRPGGGAPRQASHVPWWLPALSTVLALAVAAWALGGREPARTLAPVTAPESGAASMPALLERPDVTTFRRLSVRVRGPVTAPVEVCVRCASGWESSARITPGTTELSFGPMNWADRCTLEPRGPDGRPVAPSLVVTTPPLLRLGGLFVLPADELVVVAGWTFPPSEVEFTVESRTPPAQGLGRRARSNSRGFFREVVGGLRPSTGYRIRWQPSTGWVPTLEPRFRTLGAEHGRLVRASIQRAKHSLGSDPTAVLPLLVQASISPDPRMASVLLEALRPVSMAASIELGRFTGVAKKLMDPDLARRLLELAPNVPEWTFRKDILDLATGMGIPEADEPARQALEAFTGAEDLEACADFVGRAHTPEACDRIARRLEQLRPIPFVPVAVRAMLACDRERARHHFERWIREHWDKDSFAMSLAFLGLRLIGDGRAVEVLARAALGASHPWHRVEAGDALGHCTVPEARSAAPKLVASAWGNWSFELASVRVGAAGALAALRPLLAGGGVEGDRRRAAMLVGALGTAEDGPALKAMLAEPPPLLAGAAALALARLTGETAGPALVAAVSSGRDPRGTFSLALGTARHAPGEGPLFARLDAALANRAPGGLGLAASVLCGLGALGTPGVTRGLGARLEAGRLPEELRPLARAAMRAEEARRRGARIFAVSPQDVLLRTGLRLVYGERFELSAEGLFELVGTGGGLATPARPLTVVDSGRLIRAGAAAFLGSQALRVTAESHPEVCEQEAELLLSPYDDEVTLVSGSLPLEALTGGLLFVVRR